MNKCAGGLALAVAVVAGALHVMPAGAEPGAASERRRQTGIEETIERIEDELSELTAEERTVQDRLAEARTDRRELAAQLASTEAAIAATEAELATANDRLAAIERLLAETQRRMARAQNRLEDAQQELRDRAVAAYVNHPSGAATGVVLGATSVHDLTARAGYARAVISAQHRTIERYRAIKLDIAALRREHRAGRDTAALERNVIEARRASLEQQRQTRAELVTAASAEERREASLLDDVREQRTAHEAKLASLREESDAITRFLRSVQAGQGLVIAGSGQLALPLSGARLSSTFGPRPHPIFGTVRMHTGVDFAAPSGTPVRAAEAGRVVFAGPRGGYGNAVIIDHGGSLATLYAHLSVIGLPEGARVARGTVIGAVGATGYATGPHLHFEVRVAGNPVDPLPYF